MERLPVQDGELRTDEEDGTVALLEGGRPLRWRAKAGLVAAAAALGLAGLALAAGSWHRGALPAALPGQISTEPLLSLSNADYKDKGSQMTQPIEEGDTDVYVEDSSIFSEGDDIVIVDIDNHDAANQEMKIKTIDGTHLTVDRPIKTSLPKYNYVVDPSDLGGSHYEFGKTDAPTPAPTASTTTRPHIAPRLPSSSSVAVVQPPEHPPPPPHKAGVHWAVKLLVGLIIFVILLVILFLLYLCFKARPKTATQWIFKPRDDRPVLVLLEPQFNAEESGKQMHPGERITVVETRPAGDVPGENFFLKLADGRGWVMDREPGNEMCYQLFTEVNQIWLYEPDDALQGQDTAYMPILGEPDIEAASTGARLHPGEKFYVSEIRAFDDSGILYLKLKDGRGWVYDQAQTDGVYQEQFLCKRIVEETWVYQPANGNPVVTRAYPAIDDEKTDYRLSPGEQFEVDEIQEGDSGVLFLKLADGRGWLFNKHYEHGDMCERIA